MEIETLQIIAGLVGELGMAGILLAWIYAERTDKRALWIANREDNKKEPQ